MQTKLVKETIERTFWMDKIFKKYKIWQQYQQMRE